jgi:hypothetical protein
MKLGVPTRVVQDCLAELRKALLVGGVYVVALLSLLALIGGGFWDGT